MNASTFTICLIIECMKKSFQLQPKQIRVHWHLTFTRFGMFEMHIKCLNYFLPLFITSDYRYKNRLERTWKCVQQNSTPAVAVAFLFFRSFCEFSSSLSFFSYVMQSTRRFKSSILPFVMFNVWNMRRSNSTIN